MSEGVCLAAFVATALLYMIYTHRISMILAASRHGEGRALLELERLKAQVAELLAERDQLKIELECARTVIRIQQTGLARGPQRNTASASPWYERL